MLKRQEENIWYERASTQSTLPSAGKTGARIQAKERNHNPPLDIWTKDLHTPHTNPQLGSRYPSKTTTITDHCIACPVINYLTQSSIWQANRRQQLSLDLFGAVNTKLNNDIMLFLLYGSIRFHSSAVVSYCSNVSLANTSFPSYCSLQNAQQNTNCEKQLKAEIQYLLWMQVCWFWPKIFCSTSTQRTPTVKAEKTEIKLISNFIQICKRLIVVVWCYHS